MKVNILNNAASLLAAIVLAVLSTPSASADIAPPLDQQQLHRHITHAMGRTVRQTPRDTLGNFGLPKPYSVPCIRGGFQNMFYWDTYFTNVGLLADGDFRQARNNIECIAAMVCRFGYMPNSSSQGMLDRSQPPYLALMLNDYFDATADTVFAMEMLPVVEREYGFWMKRRISPTGLNRYGNQAKRKELIGFFNAIAPRLGIDPSGGFTDDERARMGSHTLAEAESGWDFNPRFDRRCEDFNPVDLNSLLYGYEKVLGRFHAMAGRHKQAAKWRQRADRRRELMNRLMVDPATGLFFDYDFANRRRGDCLSAAALWPLWLGVATEEQARAMRSSLDALEGAGGVMTCAPGPRTATCQWDAPNGWAACQLAAVRGLDRYGWTADAGRIADKYLRTMADIYRQTGQLWEKYNARDGSNEVANEYPMPGDFMGWTAGVYQALYCRQYGLPRPTDAARVVNVVNFIRLTEPRAAIEPTLAWITDDVLYQTTRSQIELMNDCGIRGTFLIQYDALMDPRYVALLKDAPLPGTEIGAWLEITKPHVEAAGIAWRGRYPWDWHADVGFSIGYTPQQREKLVDAYMAAFRNAFGYYPSSVGCWFIDAHTLAYLYDRYHIEAVAMCRDQIGTDGYNLWGGYWQGGFYPSRSNSLVPAQTPQGQVDVPVFRMLGSDPVEQYDSGMGGLHQGVYTLEPVYGHTGGNPQWVDWYLDVMAHDPAMTLSYAQAGQENMFTWRAMRKGLEYQLPELARMARRGEIRLETLGATGRSFKAAYPTTPPSATAALTPYDGSGKRTVWFNSRNYRLNLLWTGDTMLVRDIHLFDQAQPERYLTATCTTHDCHYSTLPVIDGNVWSNGAVRAGGYLVNAADGRPIRFGQPVVGSDGNRLHVSVPTLYGDSLEVVADENQLTLAMAGDWRLTLTAAPDAKLPTTAVGGNVVRMRHEGFDYAVTVANGTLTPLDGGGWTVRADGGKVALRFDGGRDARLTIQPHLLRCEQRTNPAIVDTPTPRLSWVNEPLDPVGKGLCQSAYRIVVASSLYKLANGDYDLWDSGKVPSAESYLVGYGGLPLPAGSRVYWRVMAWDGGDIPSAWSETASFGIPPASLDGEWLRAGMVRKQFNVGKAVSSARAYVSAMGYYELYINGKKVGGDLYSPNFTNYTYRDNITHHVSIDNEFTGYRILYLAYDVDSLLRVGDNAVGIMAGRGFAQSSTSWVASFGEPRVWCRLEIEYTDGTRQVVATDGSWLSGQSPVIMDGVFDGEIYDAAYEHPDWATAGTPSGRWQPAEVLDAPTGRLLPQCAPADRVLRSYAPISLEKTGESRWHVRFPVEVSGFIALKDVNVAKGDTINVDYICDQKLGVHRYISASDGPISYAPRFTWYVFSEATISGVDTLAAANVVAEMAGTDVPLAARLSTSDTIVNSILRIWQQSQLDNLHGGIASDCPHRERAPYTGDGQVVMPTVMAHFDAASFYRKWLRDMHDAQNPTTGYVPNGAPYQPGCGGGVAWGAAMSLMPWDYYVAYGDSLLLREHYRAMLKQLDYMTTWTTPDSTMHSRRGDIRTPDTPYYWLNLGDWCAPGPLPADELVHTFFLWECADRVAKAARVVGDTDGEAHAATIASRTWRAFHRKFYDPATRSYGEAGSNVFALYMGVPDSIRGAVVETLRHDLTVKHGGHLDTGIFATRHLFEVLSDHGLDDLAYQVLTAEGFPGFRHWLDQGATVTWEHWDGRDSRNHPMFGGGLVWLSSRLAGVSPDPDAPGYRGIIVAPRLPNGLDWADYELASPYGKVRSTLRRLADGSLEILITVPVGSRATVSLPWRSDPDETIQIGQGSWRFSNR